jgi:phosphomannomutase
MTILDKIFLAYDVRGKVGSELNSETVRDIGRAFADWLPAKGSVAVGHDMRPDSKELAEALIDGLLAQGRNVVDIGRVTSDMIYFAVGSLKLAGGAMITASHNPGEYNGIKFCRDEAKPVGVDSGLDDIKTAISISSFNTADTPGTREIKDIVDNWIEHILTFIDAQKLKPLKIAVDAGNGMAGVIFARLEPHIPFLVKEMYFEPDGTFPNHIANPLEIKNLADIRKELKKGGYQAGVAFDGDGDRAVLLDEKGEPLTGTVMSALLAEYFLDKQPGATILLNAICGQAAVDSVIKNNGKVVRTKVGHSFIKSDMRTYNALFAGEHSGHYYFRNNYCADSGLIAASIALFILSLSDKPLSELVLKYRESYVQIPETNFEVVNKQTVLQNLSNTFNSNNQDWLDGLTIRSGNGWLNVRPSNTEPLLRLNAEASSQGELDEMVEKATNIITA